MDCKIIAITNQKGGVGKTTSTLNLSVALAKEGYRVLVIDADPQASLTISMGISKPDELDVTIASVLQREINGAEYDANMGIIHQGEGVDLLPANIELSSFETSLINAMSRELVLKRYLSNIKEKYDYILIDCMPSLGMLTVNALSAADSVIIPSQPNFLSIKGLGLLMKTISNVKKNLNPALKIEGVLLTMVDNRTNNAKVIINSLRSMGSNLNIFHTEIPHSVRAAECAQKGKSIFVHDKGGKVACAYQDFTKEVLRNEENRENRFRSERSI